MVPREFPGVNRGLESGKIPSNHHAGEDRIADLAAQNAGRRI
jgi:hypothetical protein